MEIEYRGVILDVSYTVDGHYISATHEFPAEYSEVEIINIFAGDVSIIDLLLDTQIENIYEILIEKLEL